MRRKHMLLVSSAALFGVGVGLFAATLNNSNFSNLFYMSAHETHSGYHYIGEEATCTESGAREYWICCDCHQVFLDPNCEEVTHGTWINTGTTGASGVGGLAEEAFIPALGHDWVYTHIDDDTHRKECSRCGEYTIENHHYESTVHNPYGVTRGYTSHVCDECDDTYYDNFDFSLYEGVTFNSGNKHLIPYSFNNTTYTIEASVHIAKNYSSRAGVIVGSYGLEDCINLEVYTNGRPRLYIVKDNVTYDYIFSTDIRSDGIANIAMTIESENQACLYVDGQLKETKEITCEVPRVKRTLTVGGDYRNLNSMYFRGTMYAIAIYKDVRTPSELVSDIILADDTNSDHCVSYNLIDYSYFNGGGSGDDPLESASVSNLDELIYQCAIGTTEIKVINNIVVDRSIYIGGHVTIYSDDNFSITRAPGFAGDIFVCGENSYGRNLILDDIECVLTLGKESAEGVLTIDGNKANTTVDVNGALVYLSYSGTLNLRNNAKLINNKKVGNSRSFAISEWFAGKVGGAAVLIINGTFNMYGGEIRDCEVNTTNTVEDTESENYMVSCYGGAICNFRSNFNMLGGLIDGCEAYYGGAISNYGTLNMKAGTVSNNSSSHAGGAVYQNSDIFCSMTLGDNTLEDGVYNLIFDSNSTPSYAGAVYASVKGSLEIIGGVKFLNNSSGSQGGAVRTSNYINIEGDNLFTGNSASNGGALVINYDYSESVERTQCTISGAKFINNTSTYHGGALTVRGGKVNLTNCTFTNNTAGSNGGAFYTIYTNENGTKVNADVRFTSCTLSGNSATEGGAIFADLDETVYLTNCTLTSNTSSTQGGAISLHGVALLNISGTTISNNTATGNGGALYISYRTVTTTDEVSGDPVETKYDSTVVISNSNINGNTASGNTGGGAICVFVANSGFNALTASGTTFSENSAPYSGGAIWFNNGTISLTDNIFQENTCGDENHNSNGGALYISSATATISGNTFTSNSANQNGGAISIVNSTLTLTSNGFTSNSSGSHGGAIYASIVELDSSNNTFTSNTATGFGGAIHLAGCTNATFEDDEFDHNEAQEGGALYLTGSTITGSGLTFEYNNATADNDNGYGGGAIYATNSTATISNSDFDHNTSGGCGGAIEGHSGASFILSGITGTNNSATTEGGFGYVKASSISVSDNSTISGNTAGTHGGAFIARANGADAGTITISDSTVSNNSSQQNGGAIYIAASSSLNVSGTTFNGNIAYGNVNGGGAIYGTNATITVTSTSFINNSTASNGGAVCAWTNSTMTLTGITAEGNHANNKGGFAYATAGGSITVNGNSVVGGDTADKGNYAPGGGGAFFADANGTINVSYTTMSNNSSTGSGGALYAKDGGVLTISHCTISNSSGNYGGAVTVYGGVFTASDSTFSTNNAFGFGGVAYIRPGSNAQDYPGSASFTGCTFSSNSSDSTAGAINVNSGPTVTFTNCTFSENTATGNGGAIYANTNAVISFTGCTFSENSTNNGVGGALYVGSGATVTVNDTDFTSNTSSGDGGAVYNSGTFISTNNSTFTSNVSDAGGGAIYCSSGSTLTMSDTTLTSNEATTGSGGAIYLYYGSNGTFTDVDFNSNSALYGGAMIVNGATATFTRGSFDGNSCVSGGLAGAVYIRDNGSSIANVSFTGTSFSGNTSVSTGGAIHIKNASSLTLTNCSFSENEAANGGALFISETATVTISNSTFTSNSVTGNGGAINIGATATVTIGGSTFTSNSATGNGGAIYAAGTGASDRITLDIVSTTTFASNTGNNGAAIYAQYVNSDIDNIVLTGNTASANAAFYIHTTTIDIKSITASGNSGSLGGVFYVNRSTLTINSDGQGTVLFGTTDSTSASTAKNSASSGGAIYATVGADVTINNATFGYNYSSNNGGAITGSNASGCSITITDSTFIGNSAVKGGGALYAEGAAAFVVSGCTFDSNRAANGAAIYNSSANSSFVVSDCTFIDNATTSAGGAIYINAGSIDISDSAFTSNTGSSGGAIYACGESLVTISYTTFTSNSATGNGGAIYFYNDSATNYHTLLGCTFDSNNASGSAGGGAIYISKLSYVILTDTTMTNNTASSGNGKAILGTSGVSSGSTVIINGTYTTSNNDIYVGTSNFTIHADGLDDLDHDHASNTWSSIVRGTTSRVTYN